MDKTYAVVVAIEEYAGLGNKWSLSGVESQAVEFARWLIETRGLAPSHVQVFLSGGGAAFRLLGIPDAQIAVASADNINKFFAAAGKNWPGEILVIYWAGHGFVARDGSRRLILADAQPDYKTNLDFVQLAEWLRSEGAGSFKRQLGIIDACARFFEELQSRTGLPQGGLPEGRQRAGVAQFFYFAASSGEYATNNAFGPKTLEALRQAPAEEWPPDERQLRDRVERAFDAAIGSRSDGQHPAWLEYRDGFDNVSTRGVVPTLHDIHVSAQRARYPLRELRTLAELAARCPSLANPAGRDRLCAGIEQGVPLANRASSRDDAAFDLLRIIAGALEQGLAAPLRQTVVEFESNSNDAYRFDQAAARAEFVQGFWPPLAALPLRLERARKLYGVALPLRAENIEPGSLDEIVGRLLEDPSEPPRPLIEFLVRVSRETAGDPNSDKLAKWLDDQPEWADEVDQAKKRVESERNLRTYLLVQIGVEAGGCTIQRAWRWRHGSAVPEEIKNLEAGADLAANLAGLLDESEGLGGKVFLELLAPEALMHLDAGQLALRARGGARDPELSYPVALRWLDRMQAPDRDPEYLPGRWKASASAVRDRLRLRRKAVCVDANCDPDQFRAAFRTGDTGELVGIPFPSDAEGRKRIVDLICAGGVPFAWWPRQAGANVAAAEAEVQRLLNELAFDEVPEGMLRERVGKCGPVARLLLLWDDPERNPYAFKYTDVSQKDAG